MKQDRERIENDVLAVMRSEVDVQEAVIDLERQGFERGGIRVYHSEAAEQLDSHGKHSGLVTRVVKHIQSALSDENKLLEEYEKAAESGAEVIVVHAPSEEDVTRARDILQSHNAENVRHFGSWAVTDLENQGRATF